MERSAAVARAASARKRRRPPAPKPNDRAPSRPHATIPVPSVTRSATTAGAVRAIGTPVRRRRKTLLRTSPSLPGETAMESPVTKTAALLPSETRTPRSPR